MRLDDVTGKIKDAGGVRELINRNVVIVAPIVGLLILACLVMGFRRSSLASSSRQIYFTNDDGKTFFKDDQRKVPPFTSWGKECVGAILFTCAGDIKGTPFVGYMIRYTPEGKSQREA